MKFKKPNDFTTPLVQVGGFVAGIMAGRVVYNELAKKDATGKNSTMYKGGLAVAGIGGSAFVQGTDTTAVLVRSALQGLGADQTIGLLQKQVQSSNNATLRTAVGLNCPHEQYNHSLGYSEYVPLIADYSMDDTDYYESDTVSYPSEEKNEEKDLTTLGI